MEFWQGGASSGGSSASGDQTVREISLDAAILLSYAKKSNHRSWLWSCSLHRRNIPVMNWITLEEKGRCSLCDTPCSRSYARSYERSFAEADVPYPKAFDMEEINSEFSSTDVVLVIGANDVVNPAARKDTASPIYGMPILDVDNAANIIVPKRGMNAGYAGIENELFFDPKQRCFSEMLSLLSLS